MYVSLKIPPFCCSDCLLPRSNKLSYTRNEECCVIGDELYLDTIQISEEVNTKYSSMSTDRQVMCFMLTYWNLSQALEMLSRQCGNLFLDNYDSWTLVRFFSDTTLPKNFDLGLRLENLGITISMVPYL